MLALSAVMVGAYLVLGSIFARSPGLMPIAIDPPVGERPFAALIGLLSLSAGFLGLRRSRS
jgi:hypothetical protein